MEDTVAAVAASHLRPAVGEEVRVWATWQGTWPAEVAWEGVDAGEGLLARVTPRVPGLLTVRAGDRPIVLEVQAATNAAPVPVTAVAVPLPDVDAEACADDRFPTLAGSWIVGCSSSGRVDRAWHVGTWEQVDLRDAARSPGVGPGVVYDPDAGLWRLPGGEPDRSLPRFGSVPVAPPAVDGAHVAVPLADHVEVFAVGTSTRTHTDASPWPGAPMALAWPWAAWTQADPLTGADVWVRDSTGRARPLARNPGDERNVSGDGRWAAWTGPGGVYVEDLDRGERRAYAADTGFYGGLGQWGPVVCWEDRAALVAGAGDIDVRCSDGVEVRRPGQQLHPARHGPWVLYREEGRTWVATASELVLDDDDPRAEGGGPTVPGGYGGAHRDGGVLYEFEWPAEGWRVWRFVDGAWAAGEALATGTVRIESPAGDAIRLAPG